MEMPDRALHLVLVFSEGNVRRRQSMAKQISKMEQVPGGAPPVSKARHGRADEGRLAGGAPWSPDRPAQDGQSYDKAGKPVLYPAEPGGDCNEGT